MIEFKRQLWGREGRNCMARRGLKRPFDRQCWLHVVVWQCKFIIYPRAPILCEICTYARACKQSERNPRVCTHAGGGRAMIYVRRGAICANSSSSPSCARAQLNSDNHPRKSLPARTDCTPFWQQHRCYLFVLRFPRNASHMLIIERRAMIYSWRLRILLQRRATSAGKSDARRNRDQLEWEI